MRPARISMIVMDDWTIMINAHDHEMQTGSIDRVMVDSGAAVSACPLKYALEIPIANSIRKSEFENRVWRSDRARWKEDT